MLQALPLEILEVIFSFPSVNEKSNANEAAYELGVVYKEAEVYFNALEINKP